MGPELTSFLTIVVEEFDLTALEIMKLCRGKSYYKELKENLDFCLNLQFALQ